MAGVFCQLIQSLISPLQRCLTLPPASERRPSHTSSLEKINAPAVSEFLSEFGADSLAKSFPGFPLSLSFRALLRKGTFLSSDPESTDT